MQVVRARLCRKSSNGVTIVSAFCLGPRRCWRCANVVATTLKACCGHDPRFTPSTKEQLSGSVRSGSLIVNGHAGLLAGFGVEALKIAVMKAHVFPVTLH